MKENITLKNMDTFDFSTNETALKKSNCKSFNLSFITRKGEEFYIGGAALSVWIIYLAGLQYSQQLSVVR